MCACACVLFVCPKPSRCENQLEQVCVDIDKTINQTIQNTLNTLERDCETIAKLTEEKLEKDRLGKGNCRQDSMPLMGAHKADSLRHDKCRHDVMTLCV